MAKMVLGVFSDRVLAEDAISQLEDEGYNPKDFSIIMKDRGEATAVAESTGVGDVAGGAASGAVTGAVLGGLAGLVSVFALPGLGAFFIGGPIASALGLTGAAASTVSGAATGAVAGGIIGALTGWGVSDEDARYYERRINEGGILLAVPTRPGEEAEVMYILEENQADQVRSVLTKDSKRNLRADVATGYGRAAHYSEIRRGKK